ncbi:Virion core protein [Sea otter poxvirus]|uniref:Virion core protein n=1 Tax=Sea otter poxvirus TaxID=1416741 RepID=A0A2U9QHP7_9POXV|nr:Virion core protein [Sea otter poxvirus]AWU47124.1 Virion core protein [Sea otter poxvirus]
MDIYTTRDNIYPTNSEYTCNEYFILLGNHSTFLKNKLSSVKSRPAFFTKLLIHSTIDGNLYTKILQSSIFVRDRYVTPSEFVYAGYPILWAVGIPNEIDILQRYDAISIYVVIYRDYRCDGWRYIVCIQCPDEYTPPTNIMFDDMKVKYMDTFLSCPYIALHAYPLQYNERSTLFMNAILRYSVNSIIFKVNMSKLYKLIQKIIPINDKSCKYTAFINHNDSTNSKLALINYDRNSINAFEYAWFCGQLTILNLENEKIIDVHRRVHTLL